MSKSLQHEIIKLQKRINALELENKNLKKHNRNKNVTVKTVSGPSKMTKLFAEAEISVANYFDRLTVDPEKASINVDNERYVLMRASSLSIDFFEKIKDLYADKGEDEAIRIGQNFLFDIAHVIGLKDASSLHEKLDLNTPVAKLSAGPVHFAHSGWSNVDIIEGNPSPDENFYLKYNHPSSFEADSWIKSGKVSKNPVCIMNAGYSSGWCEESFGIPLTSVEISCRAKGDEKCTFVMAHPSKIQAIIDQIDLDLQINTNYEIPRFFVRKQVEQDLMNSINEKSILLKEVHHRVKNNLQLISSLLNLQSHHIKNRVVDTIFSEIKNRIKAIALVHEKLYQSSDVEHVNLEEYLRSIIQLISESLTFGHKISFNVPSQVERKITIDKALPCGLILNELIANAIKYAFPPLQFNGEKNIQIDVSETKGVYKINVKDNGIGLPDTFDLSQVNSLGFDIILSLLDQINGQISFETKTDLGSTFTIEF